MKHVFFVTLSVVFLIFGGHIFSEASADDNEIVQWKMHAEPGIREKSFYQYDATNDYIYFTYSEYDCVDVYDANGLFQYSIVFPKMQNGTIGVRCEDNKVYISAKNDSVFIFEGTEEIAQLTYEQARASKIDFSWFQQNNDRITVDKEKICWLNDRGEIIKEVSTPITIKNTIPSSSLGSLGTVIIIILFFPLLLLLRKAGVK